MRFDIYWVDLEHPGDSASVNEWKQWFKDIRDMGAYFSTDDSGTWILQLLMSQRHMMFHNSVHPPFPSRSDYPDNEQQFLEEEGRVRRWRPDEPGISSHKLSGNDGWIVTPEEIKEAFDLKPRWSHLFLDDSDFWQRWLIFMDEAMKHGGFQVF